VSVIVIAAFLAIPTLAATFNPGAIISDFEFFNSSAMSLTSITGFLKDNGGAIATMNFSTGSGTKTAAEIIYNAAREYRINPQVIIATLQKEQSLITATNPSTTSLNYAMGYGCPDSGGCSQNASGFYKQIDYAVWQLRKYTTYPTQYHYQIGNTYTFSDLSGTKISTVKIQNQATANLYNYTPHVYNGNYNFFNLWTKWFLSYYPDGTLIKSDSEPQVWLIYNGTRHLFRSRIAFETRGYSLRTLITAPASEVNKFSRGGDIDFPNHSVVKDEFGNIYLLDGLNKRPMTKKTFDQLGFYEEELLGSAQGVTSKKLGVFQTTSFIVVAETKAVDSSANASGVLVQDTSTGAIGYVQDSVLHMIHSVEVLRTQFSNRSWIKISHSDFTSFKRGAGVKLRDGTLAMSPKYGGQIFVITNGKKRRVTNPEVFFGLGYKLENVLRTNDRTLDLHPTAAAISG
jgi:hypothetical protein